MNEQELELILKNSKELITVGNARQIFHNIAEVVYEIDDDGKIFYDFLGEVLLAKPHFLEGKNYTQLIKSYNANFKKIDPSDPIKLEQYFLEKYCILDEEEILFSFYGAINYINYKKGKGILFLDRVFITNIRIIVFLTTFGDMLIHPGTPFGFGKIAHLAAALDRKIRKKIKSNREAKRDISFLKVTAESEKKLSFGYQFPISNPTAITLEKWKKGKNKGTLRRVTFNSKTETQSYDLGVVVSKERYENWEGMLHKITEILQNLQEQ